MELLLKILKNIEFWKIVIPSCVTIIGLIISYKLNKRNVINEIFKAKNINSSEKLRDYFLPLLKIIQNKDNDITEEERVNNLNDIFNIILLYGSNELVRIATSFREATYKANGKQDVNEIFAYVGLLISQYKYEVSGQYIPSDTWYKYTIRDYNLLKDRIVNLINMKVDELKLSESLKCK